MEQSSSSIRWVDRLYRRFPRLGRSLDNELEQSLMRLGFAGLFVLYMLGFQLSGSLMIGRVQELTTASLAYVAISLLIIASIAVWPRQVRTRRAICTLLDAGMISLAMWLGGEITSILYIFYLWITLGNGLRYGRPYLYFTSGLCVAGFTLVIAGSDYWWRQNILGFGLLLGLLIIPLFVSSLLKRLEAENRRAETASQAKSRFLANMSHEIRTPLNGVVGMADLLVGTPLNEEQQDIVHSIHASSESLLSLIEDILDFSKIEAGKVEVTPVDQEVTDLIHDTVAMIRPQAMTKSIALEHWIEPEVPPRIRIDPLLLRQILVNLLSNAVKFTEEGEVLLRLSYKTRRLDESQSEWLLFEVTDTGIGISEQHLQRIFERFTQLDDSVTRRYAGTGLGTTITKQLVELLGGEIGVESRLGEGSRFWFELPLQRAAKAVDESLLQTAQWLLFTDGRYQESQTLNHLQECNLITKVTHSTADGFQELLNAVSLNRPYDVAIVDQARIDLPADQLAGAIRAERLLKNLPLVLVMSEPLDWPHMRSLRRAGYHVILGPPLTLEKFRNGLCYAIKARGEKPGEWELPAARSQCPAPRPYRVLLAEDNYINQKVAQKILQRAGHDVRVTDTGEEALRALTEEHFDVVILDMQMPDMGGVEVIERYRGLHGADETPPIMMLTANATIDAQAQCREMGVRAFLTKPVRSGQLVAILDEIMSGRSAFPAPTQTTDTASEEETERQQLIIDPSVIEDLAKLSRSPDFLQQLTEKFFQDSEALLDEMRLAARACNLERYREHAHALAGNAAGMGAHTLQALCAAVTDIDQRQFDELAENIFTETSATYSLTHQALLNYLASRSMRGAQ
ncbi:MAG: ATP-binding protein [Candidatus Thiodiazotropha sp.]